MASRLRCMACAQLPRHVALDMYHDPFSKCVIDLRACPPFSQLIFFTCHGASSEACAICRGGRYTNPSRLGLSPNAARGVFHRNRARPFACSCQSQHSIACSK